MKHHGGVYFFGYYYLKPPYPQNFHFIPSHRTNKVNIDSEEISLKPVIHKFSYSTKRDTLIIVRGNKGNYLPSMTKNTNSEK